MTRLTRRIVEKPWGRTDVPAHFGDVAGRRVGEIWFEDADGDDAPLMIKYLFTSERLSIQVHPDNDQARARGFPSGKDECWLVLDADDDAEIGMGLAHDTDAGTLAAAARDGAIETMLMWHPARNGDFAYNRANTIHAIGPGLMLVEVQQNVDCTYRLYDYGRPRELHLDDGLAVSDTRAGDPAPLRQVAPAGNELLVAGPHFHLLLAEADFDVGALAGAKVVDVAPISGEALVDGETIAAGECGRTRDPGAVSVWPGARALIAWTV